MLYLNREISAPSAGQLLDWCLQGRQKKSLIEKCLLNIILFRMGKGYISKTKIRSGAGRYCILYMQKTGLAGINTFGGVCDE